MRIARRLLPVILLAAVLMISAAHASGQGDPAALPPTPVPSDASEPAPQPSPVPDQTDPPPPPAAPAPPSPTAQPPVGVTVSRAGASATKSVSIVNFAFSPGSITVNLGDTVRWTNQDAAPEGHDVTGDGLDSGLMNQGDTYIHTFSSAGTVSYICTIHPNMKGTVNVLARSSGGSGENGDPEAADGGGSAAAAPAPADSEAAAVASPGAAGSQSSLPATGEDWLTVAAAGLGLLCLGLALRSLAFASMRRR